MALGSRSVPGRFCFRAELGSMRSAPWFPGVRGSDGSILEDGEGREGSFSDSFVRAARRGKGTKRPLVGEVKVGENDPHRPGIFCLATHARTEPLRHAPDLISVSAAAASAGVVYAMLFSLVYSGSVSDMAGRGLLAESVVRPRARRPSPHVSDRQRPSRLSPPPPGVPDRRPLLECVFNIHQREPIFDHSSRPHLRLSCLFYGPVPARVLHHEPSTASRAPLSLAAPFELARFFPQPNSISPTRKCSLPLLHLPLAPFCPGKIRLDPAVDGPVA